VTRRSPTSSPGTSGRAEETSAPFAGDDLRVRGSDGGYVFQPGGAEISPRLSTLTPYQSLCIPHVSTDRVRVVPSNGLTEQACGLRHSESLGT
jgi:hypothetical protein